MAKKHYRSKDELCRQANREAALITASEKAHLLLTISVLWDVFDFDENNISEFMEAYHTVLDSYNSGNEDMDLIAANIYEMTGIKIL